MTAIIFECGGTNLRYGLTDGQKILSSTKIKTPKQWPAAHQAFIKLNKDILGTKKINQIVGGVPGVLDKGHHTLLAAPALPKWVNRPLRHDLQKIYRAPVRLENDAALGGLGEAVYGAGKKHRIVAYLAVGTGVGGARLVDQAIDAVNLGFEPGHQMINHRQTLSKTIGGFYLEKKYKNDLSKITATDWRWVTDQLAIGLINVITMWSPDIIVLGGSVVLKGRISMPYLRSRVASWLRVVPKAPPIVKAQLGDQAGLYGAMALIKKT